MANTYTRVYIHVVFATKARSPIPVAHLPELHAYIAGILARLDQRPLAVGGMPDHVHAFFGHNPKLALSDIVRDVKAGSSKLINDRSWLPGRFQWQAGYGAFSHSHREVASICTYIQDQQRRHAKRTFREEYLRMLDTFCVDFDSRYVFDQDEGR
jgi:putative transposase